MIMLETKKLIFLFYNNIYISINTSAAFDFPTKHNYNNSKDVDNEKSDFKQESSTKHSHTQPTRRKNPVFGARTHSPFRPVAPRGQTQLPPIGQFPQSLQLPSMSAAAAATSSSSTKAANSGGKIRLLSVHAGGHNHRQRRRQAAGVCASSNSNDPYQILELHLRLQ